jgi:hypothetical protein
MALEKELATYHAALMNLLDREGQFVVVHGEQVDGFWDSYEAALKEGYDRFGLDPFLVKKIQRIEPVHFITRGVPTCHS